MIVIPMAGESSRFRAGGYTQPKYMLDLLGRPLFDWTVMSFRSLFQHESFLFIARDVQETKTFIADRIAVLDIRHAEVVILDRPTRGQADTVALGLQASHASDDASLTIFNIDTLRPNYRPPTDPTVMASAGWLEVFEGPGDQWSFVEKDPYNPPVVLRTTEKDRISDLCCTGLYHFKTRSVFEVALAAERVKAGSAELYVAPIYNHLIAAGSTVTYRQVPRGGVLFSGIPAEYEELKANPARLTAFDAHDAEA